MVPFLPHPVMGAGPITSLYSQIKSLGLDTSLQFVIDAGDAGCYPGSGQTLTDLSGNGINFTRGPTSGAESGDPTFVGVAGRQSAGEYFSLDSDDTLQGPTGTWLNNAAKTNALFSYAAWQYIASDPPLGATFLTSGADTDPGIALQIGYDGFLGDDALVFSLYGNGGAGPQDVAYGPATILYGKFIFIALSYVESTGAAILQVNGTQANVVQRYAPAATANQSVGLKVEATGATGRVQCAAWWNRGLSAAELQRLYNASRRKFGL